MVVWTCVRPVPALAQQVTVAGTVVEAAQGTPVRDATVRISGAPAVSTNRSGRFIFDPLPPGRHTLSVDALGYTPISFELDVRADTVLTIELQVVPVELDSIVVDVGTFRVRGDMRDARTGRHVLHGQVTQYPGGRTSGARSGRFSITAPRNTRIAVVAQAIEYLPERVEFVAGRDTTLDFRLEVDSVAVRIVARQVVRLEQRADAVPLSVRSIGREELDRAGSVPIAELIRRRLPAGVIPARGPVPLACVMLDDAVVPFELLIGITPETVERIEIYGLRGNMIRVYTRRYVAGLMGRRRLPKILYVNTGMSVVCQ